MFLNVERVHIILFNTYCYQNNTALNPIFIKNINDNILVSI